MKKNTNSPYASLKKLNILWTEESTPTSIYQIDMSKVTIENNMFLPMTEDDLIIASARYAANTYSAKTFKDQGLSNKIYTVNSQTNMMKSGSEYRTNAEFSVEQGKTINDSGVGINHPYLENMKIPSYIGASNPNDDAWINGVLNLRVTQNTVPINLRNGSGDPNWIEDSSGGNVDGKIDVPRNLRILNID